MGEPVGLLSMGSHRVGHDWSDLAAAAASLRLISVTHTAVNIKNISIMPESSFVAFPIQFLSCPLNIGPG